MGGGRGAFMRPPGMAAPGYQNTSSAGGGGSPKSIRLRSLQALAGKEAGTLPGLSSPSRIRRSPWSNGESRGAMVSIRAGGDVSHLSICVRAGGRGSSVSTTMLMKHLQLGPQPATHCVIATFTRPLDQHRASETGDRGHSTRNGAPDTRTLAHFPQLPSPTHTA